VKRILILGLNPLPTENDTCTLAPGKRTWQFVSPLLENGHRICLVCSRHLAAIQDIDYERIKAEEHSNLIYYSVIQDTFENMSWLQQIHDNFDPDCIVGATVYPSYIATRLRTNRPIWADLFGHIMAEAQTKSQVFSDNYYLSKLWGQEKTILDRADILSVVSKPQSYATIGELGTRFRLNRLTTGYQFTRVVPCSINENTPFERTAEQPVLRGKYVPKDAFIILWSGGYNTWADVKTLFRALETIFRLYPHAFFVSTGGEIASHDEITYRFFLNQIEKSKYKDRFIMRGWIPFSEIPSCIRESNIGVNIDLFSYEGILGSRNRLMDWMQFKLPILTSELCDLSIILKDNSLGLTFEPENADSLVDTLKCAIEDPDSLKKMADKAHDYCIKHFSSRVTTLPLQEWVLDPRRAPDHRDQRNPDSQSSSDTILSTIRHYHASIRNNIRSGGVLHTVKWILARTPGIRRLPGFNK
jgi:glycosyltransferase involved in cell wall biosynthesis